MWLRIITKTISILITVINIKIIKTTTSFLSILDKKNFNNNLFYHSCNMWYYSNFYLNIFGFFSFFPVFPYPNILIIIARIELF